MHDVVVVVSYLATQQQPTVHSRRDQLDPSCDLTLSNFFPAETLFVIRTALPIRLYLPRIIRVQIHSTFFPVLHLSRSTVEQNSMQILIHRYSPHSSI